MRNGPPLTTVIAGGVRLPARAAPAAGAASPRAEWRAVLIVLKYGGNAMARAAADDALLDDVAARIGAGDRVVLVHGGGPHIDAALRERGIASQRVAGLRVTNAATLSVTESVLCGSVNKALVRALLARGVAAAGVSGEDGALLVARPIDAPDGTSLGFVGEIEAVTTALAVALLDAGFVPVVAPVGVTRDGRTALNVNADTAAGALAGALGADAYVVVTDVTRVLRDLADPRSGIEALGVAEARALLDDGTFSGGMRPKIASALDALAGGARVAYIGDSLGRALAGDGTTLVRG